MTRKRSNRPKFKITVFDIGESDQVGASLPRSRPGRLQLVFVNEDRTKQQVIELSDTHRVDLAMSLLGLDGMRAKVVLTRPREREEGAARWLMRRRGGLEP